MVGNTQKPGVRYNGGVKELTLRSDFENYSYDSREADLL